MYGDCITHMHFVSMSLYSWHFLLKSRYPHVSSHSGKSCVITSLSVGGPQSVECSPVFIGSKYTMFPDPLSAKGLYLHSKYFVVLSVHPDPIALFVVYSAII